MPVNKDVGHTKLNLYDLFYSTKAKKTYTNLGLSLILLIVFFGFALIPTLLTLDDVKDSIEEYKTLNSGLESKIQAMDALYDQRFNSIDEGGVREHIDFIDKAFLKDVRLTNIYLNIQKRAEENNVILQSISISQSTITGDLTIEEPSQNAFTVSLGLQSETFENIIKFTNSLETYSEFPIPSQINSLSLADMRESENYQNSNVTNSNSPQFNSSLSLIVYLDPNFIE